MYNNNSIVVWKIKNCFERWLKNSLKNQNFICENETKFFNVFPGNYGQTNERPVPVFYHYTVIFIYYKTSTRNHVYTSFIFSASCLFSSMSLLYLSSSSFDIPASGLYLDSGLSCGSRMTSITWNTRVFVKSLSYVAKRPGGRQLRRTVCSTEVYELRRQSGWQRESVVRINSNLQVVYLYHVI